MTIQSMMDSDELKEETKIYQSELQKIKLIL